MKQASFDFIVRRRMLGCLLGLGGSGAFGAAVAGTSEQPHDHADHSAHMAAAAKTEVKRRELTYQVPAITMLDQRGRKVVFSKALEDGRPVIMNFVFTSCTTVCPVMTQIFAQVQARLGAAAERVHMVSVSIDPEYDTPGRLLAYARGHGAGSQWDFYTGSNDASIAVQKAFDAYRGDKMNHAPLTLLRGARGSTWVRLDGFVSPDEIVGAYRTIAA
jgi:protein SCO1/2